MSLEELPEGTPRTTMMPVDTDGCPDIDDMCGRLSHLEKIEQLRREEDAKMSERFSGIREALMRIESRQESDHALILETRDVTLRNNHDLNNGLKTKVTAIARKVGALDASFAKREAEDTAENRARVIREIHTSIDEEAKTGKHRTIEVWAAVIGATVILRELGVITWIVDIFR